MLIAWDPVAQREVWRSDRRGPWNGGTLATAGGLVFQGTGDGQFLALDARTGKTLWSTDNQAATLAGPISYEIGGEQYVAVLGGYGGSFFLIEGFLAASEGHALNGRVYVFKLGGTAPRPALNLQKAPIAKPPVIAGQRRRLRRGASPLRRQLHGVPRRRRRDRRRPSGPSAVATAPGRRRLAASGRRRRTCVVGHAAFRQVCLRGGRGADPRLRRQAGRDALRSRGQPPSPESITVIDPGLPPSAEFRRLTP